MLLTGEQIVVVSINGKGGQGKIRSWSDEADEAFPIEAIRNHTTGKRPTFKSSAWNDQTPGRPWKVDAPNPVWRGRRDLRTQKKSDASHPYTNSNLRPINSQAWKKNDFSWSNDGWFRFVKLPTSDLAHNWNSILKPNPSLLEMGTFNTPNGHKKDFNPPLGYGPNKFQNGRFSQDRASRADRAEAWRSTAPTRNQRSNLDQVGKNEPGRRYQSMVYPNIHKPVRKFSRPTVILDDNKINLARLQWGENIKINVLLNDYYLIDFMKNEDMFKAKNKGPYTLEGIGVHIIDWKPIFNPWFHSLPECTVWLRLYNCPSNYWHIEIIKDICKELGTFVSVDDILEDRVWGCFIRICINTGQISSIPKEVKIIGAGKIWIQRIDIEDQVHLCPKCFSREHIGLDCEVSASILKSYACVQTKSIDMKLYKENTEKRETNDVEQSSAAMRVLKQALLNLLDDAKSLQKDIAIELATSLSSVPNKAGVLSVMEDKIISPLPADPIASGDLGKKGPTIDLEEGEIDSSASEWEEDLEPVASLILDNTTKGFAAAPAPDDEDPDSNDEES
ncbi:hypothetical protein SUGI_0601380 [Cryptomeria japonica]|nr:hypothetical protein SUGI_0601380 [Cryptomeria japonica]